MRWGVVVLGLAALPACHEDLGLDGALFACQSDTDCARGTRCELAVGYCVDTSDRVACGNGRVELGEECDVPPGGDARGCEACRVAPFWSCTRELGFPSTCTSERFTAIAAGAHHLCALTDEGAIRCAGSNVGTAGDEANQAVPPEGRFDQLVAGTAHTCARTPQGLVRCFGSNLRPGEAGAVVTGQSTVPFDLGIVDAITAGPDSTCARAGSSVRCWGFDVEQITPPSTTEWVDLDVADQFACGLDRDATLHCWGWPGFPGENRTTPPMGRVKRFSLAAFYGCAVMETGEVRCWGREAAGRTLPPPAKTFTRVSTGGYFGCGLHESGTIECWGLVDQLDVPFESYVPDERFVDLAAGAQFACALREDGTIRCFGLVFGSF